MLSFFTFVFESDQLRLFGLVRERRRDLFVQKDGIGRKLQAFTSYTKYRNQFLDNSARKWKVDSP